MLTRITYNCPKCGLDYNFLVYINNNELGDRVGSVQQKCSKCGEVITATSEEIKAPYITVNGSNVSFLDYNILKLTEDNITIDLKSLMNMGFSGNIHLILPDETQVVGVNSLYKRIGKIKLKKSINKTMRFRKVTPVSSSDIFTNSTETASNTQPLNTSESYADYVRRMTNEIRVPSVRENITGQSARGAVTPSRRRLLLSSEEE